MNPGLVFFLGGMTALTVLTLAYAAVHVLQHLGVLKDDRR